jgi:acetolactate synthase-1/3 small subunit
MAEKIRQFTFSVFTEDKPGVLHRLSNLFSKRKINIKSLTVSHSERQGFSRFTITIDTHLAKAQLICKQLEKIIEVEKALYFENKHMFYKEIALYKVEAPGDKHAELHDVIIHYSANLNEKNGDLFFLSLTGNETEIDIFKRALKPYKLLEFVKSGRIAITK